MGSIADKYINKINQGSNAPTEEPTRRLSIADKYINKINKSNELPAETAIPPVAAISEPSPIADMPPVDPTGGFRSPTSGVTETNALLAQQIADQNRAAQIANAPNVTELDSVFYPKTFDPAVTGQNALETERQRLAQVLGEAGPTIAKTEMNINPSISQVQGVPGNYSTTSEPVAGMPISDAAAVDLMAFGNTSQMPDADLNRSLSDALEFGDLGARANVAGYLGDANQELEDGPIGSVMGFGTEYIARPIRDALGLETKTRQEIAEAFSSEQAMRELNLRKSSADLNYDPMYTKDVKGPLSALQFAATKTAESLSPMLAAIATKGTLTPLMGMGEVNNNLKDIEGLSKEDRIRLATAGGAIYGVLENLGIGMLLKGVPKEVVGKLGTKGIIELLEKNGLGRLTKAVTAGIASEAITEAAQDGVSIGAEAIAGKNFEDGEIGSRLFEAAAAGGAGGGTIRGAIQAGTEAVELAADPLTTAAKQTMRDIDNAEFTGEDSATQTAIDLLNPDSRLYQPDSDPSATQADIIAEASRLADRMEATGGGGANFAQGVRARINNLPNDKELTDKDLDYYRTKLSELEATPSEIPDQTNILQRYFETKEGRSNTQAKYEKVISDGSYAPIIQQAEARLNELANQLKELGFDKRKLPTVLPPDAKAIKDEMSRLSGITIRLINRHAAALAGNKKPKGKTTYAQDADQTAMDLAQRLGNGSLTNSGANVTPLDRPDIPTADGDLQPPPANQQPVNVAGSPGSLLQPAAPSSPAVETDNPIKPTPAQMLARASVLEGATRSMLDMDETAANAMLDTLEESFPGIKAEILSFKKPAMPIVPESGPNVQTSTEAPTAPVIEDEAPAVNPQEAEPVGREVPSKPVTSIQTPDSDAKFNVQGRVIELADLKQATGDLQPRDRSRSESQSNVLIRATPQKFNPERLMDSPTTDSGAPIIARDGTIISGNGRVLTLQEVYSNQPESLKSYNEFITAQGIDVSGFSQPVFVRQLTDDMDISQLKQFADAANVPSIAEMSVTETAQRDASRLTDKDIIGLYEGGEVNSLQNDTFVKAFASQIVSENERGKFSKDGKPTREGIARMQNAILASAFQDTDAISIMLEDADPNIKAIANSYISTAPKFAQLKKQIADGRTDAQFDITSDLAEMANLVSRLRREGTKLQDYYNQSDMLSAPDPEVQRLVRAFYNEGLTRANSTKAMKDFLDFYTTEALQKESGGLLPDQATASDIIEAGRQRTEEKRSEAKGQQQPGLELAASGNVKRNDARGKQVPKRRNAESGERAEAVKPRAESKVDDARSESEVEQSVEGVAELRNTESTSPANADTREENTRGTKAGRVTIAQSQTLRQSLYRDAFADAGLEVDTAVNLPITNQYRILSKLVTEKFGLSFVEKPRQGAGYDQVNALLDAYHNLQWMTHTMAMPNKAIGLDGTLGLALPQNAWGGYLAAYVNKEATTPDNYQSDINPVAGPVILMPGRSNSFAHEWGHALDYHILDRIGNDWGRGVTGRIRTNLEKGEMVYADNAPQNVVEAMGDLMNAMFMENAEVSAQIMKMESEVARLQAKQDKRTNGKPIKKLTDMKEQLRELREGSSKKRISKSQYRKDAETFATENKSDVSYWTRPTEMFARAFEAYIARNVEAAGGNTEFISFENEAYELAMDKVKGGDDRLALTYPNDPDRMRIFMAMDRLMDELRADVIQEGTAADAPGDTDMIDAQAEFYKEVDVTKKERISIIADQKRAWTEHKNMRAKIKSRPQRYKSDLARFQDTAGVVVINTKRGILFNIAARYKDNPAAKALIESVIARVATDPGSTDNRVTVAGGTFEEAVRGASRRYAGIWAGLLQEHKLESFSALDNKELRLFLTSDETTQANAPDRIKRAAGDIRNRLLNPMYDYMRKNGLDVNYLPEGGFMPRMMDALLVADSKEKFVNGLPGEKKRGAKALYSDVIYENELGVIDVNDADQASALVKMARKLEGSLDESTADAAAELKFKLKQIERESAKLDDPEADPGDVEANIMQLQEEAADLHQQLYDDLRDPYSTEAAKDWYDRVVRRQVGDISRHGVQGSFAKSRKLPPEADTYMVDFYLDPTEAITNYISGVTRKVEFEKRFGTKNVPKGKRKRTSGNSIDPAGNVHDFMSYVSEEMAAAGMKEHEVRQIQKIVEVVTGTGAQTDFALETVLNTLNTFGTMALLPRAVISSIAEPMTAAVTTGSVTDGFRAFAYSLDEFATFVRGRTARERKQYYKQLGSILGVIDLPESGEVIANRIGGTAEEDSKNAARLGRFFFRTGLISITNAQRRGSLRVGIRYLGQLGEQYAKPASPQMKDRAREVLQDFGVRPDDMDQFADFMMNLEKNEKGMYEIDSIIDRSGELSDMGEILALATRRFTDQTIQDPKIIDRPMYAESPVGRIVFGIQSFVAAFQRNVLIASAKRVQREYENRGAASAIPYAGLNVALPLGSLFLSHTFVSAVREMLLNPDKWEEEKEADNLEMYLLTLGLSRSGFIGRMDPLVNAMTSLKYQSDLSNMMVGASGAYYLKAAQRMASIRPEFMGGSNSPNTVSAEYQFTRGVYDVVVPTALSMLATHTGLGPVASAAAGVSAAAGSSPAVKHYVLRSVIKQLYDEEYRPGRSGRKSGSGSRGGAFR